jgi:hypothetical protein
VLLQFYVVDCLREEGHYADFKDCIGLNYLSILLDRGREVLLYDGKTRCCWLIIGKVGELISRQNQFPRSIS